MPASADVTQKDSINCWNERVPIALTPGATVNQSIYGQMCYSGAEAPTSVQLLVSGLTYNHYYWDVPGYHGQYSYVRFAAAAGYATFNVDPIGTGLSSHPPSTQVTIASSAYTLHQVITALRSGLAGRPAFRHVVYVGQSLGTEVGWAEAATYRDVDAFVATAAAHRFNQHTLTEFAGDGEEASADPAFAGLGLDAGYLTTGAGVRGALFYDLARTDPSIIQFDEGHKDVASLTEMSESAGLVAGDPADSISQHIDVPVLLVIGQDDALQCGDTGLDCATAASVAAVEAQYYSPAARLRVVVVPGSGHDVALEPSALLTDARITAWLCAQLRP